MTHKKLFVVEKNRVHDYNYMKLDGYIMSLLQYLADVQFCTQYFLEHVIKYNIARALFRLY